MISEIDRNRNSSGYTSSIRLYEEGSKVLKPENEKQILDRNSLGRWFGGLPRREPLGPKKGDLWFSTQSVRNDPRMIFRNLSGKSIRKVLQVKQRSSTEFFQIFFFERFFPKIQATSKRLPSEARLSGAALLGHHAPKRSPTRVPVRLLVGETSL